MRALLLSAALVLACGFAASPAFAGDDLAATPLAVSATNQPGCLAAGATSASGPELSTLGTPEPILMTNCQWSYQWCVNGCSVYPDPSYCELGCACSYYSCVGLELPNECLY